MSKSYWMSDDKIKGNYTAGQVEANSTPINNSDSFNKDKHYIGVRMQQGVPILDRDWNEMEDIRRYQEMRLRKDYLGNGSPDDGFKIEVLATPGNDFIVKAGHMMVDGFEVENDTDSTFTDLIANGRAVILPSNASALSVPADWRWDSINLDVWIEEITAVEDEDLKNSQDLGMPTTVRHKLRWRIVVVEDKWHDISSSIPQDHHLIKLAEIQREPGKPTIETADIKESRIVNSLKTLLDKNMLYKQGMIIEKGDLNDYTESGTCYGVIDAGDLTDVVFHNIPVNYACHFILKVTSKDYSLKQIVQEFITFQGESEYRFRRFGYQTTSTTDPLQWTEWKAVNTGGYDYVVESQDDFNNLFEGGWTYSIKADIKSVFFKQGTYSIQGLLNFHNSTEQTARIDSGNCLMIYCEPDTRWDYGILGGGLEITTSNMEVHNLIITGYVTPVPSYPESTCFSITANGVKLYNCMALTRAAKGFQSYYYEDGAFYFCIANGLYASPSPSVRVTFTGYNDDQLSAFSGCKNLYNCQSVNFARDSIFDFTDGTDGYLKIIAFNNCFNLVNCTTERTGAGTSISVVYYSDHFAYKIFDFYLSFNLQGCISNNAGENSQVIFKENVLFHHFISVQAVGYRECEQIDNCKVEMAGNGLSIEFQKDFSIDTSNIGKSFDLEGVGYSGCKMISNCKAVENGGNLKINYTIPDLTQITVSGNIGGTGFYYCNNVTNCRAEKNGNGNVGIQSPNEVVIDSDGYRLLTSNYGFHRCELISSSFVDMAFEIDGSTIGMYWCNDVSGCEIRCNTNNGFDPNVIGLYYGESITGCNISIGAHSNNNPINYIGVYNVYQISGCTVWHRASGTGDINLYAFRQCAYMSSCRNVMSTNMGTIGNSYISSSCNFTV